MGSERGVVASERGLWAVCCADFVIYKQMVFGSFFVFCGAALLLAAFVVLLGSCFAFCGADVLFT